MAFDIGGVIGGALTGLINNEFAQERQHDSQNFQADLQSRSQTFNSAEAALQRDWAKQMSDTTWQRGVQDIRNAGLNPALAYGHGGATAYSGASASSGAGGGGIAHAQTDLVHSMQSASQVDVNQAHADKLRAEAEEVRARTPRHEWDIREIQARIPKHEADVEHIKQQIGESAVRIEKLWEEANVAKHSAVNIQQQTANLRETVSQIRAQVQHLKALSAKESAETDEIKQRIKANLPDMERQLMSLERLQREMAQPDQANQERAADSLVGQISAYLRKMNPFNTGIGIVPVPRGHYRAR